LRWRILRGEQVGSIRDRNSRAGSGATDRMLSRLGCWNEEQPWRGWVAKKNLRGVEFGECRSTC